MPTPDKLSKKARLDLLTEIFSRLGFAFDNFPDFRTIHYDSAGKLAEDGSYNALVDRACIHDTIMEICSAADPIIKANARLSPEQAVDLSKKAEQFLQGIPYKYKVLMRIPDSSKFVGKCELNETTYLMNIGEEENNAYKEANKLNDKAGQEDSDSGLRALLQSLKNPQKSLPVPGSYLIVDVHGRAQRNDLYVFEADPMYLYKVFFALCYATGNLKKRNTTISDVYGALNIFTFSVYYDNNEFATLISRPVDESKLISAYEFQSDKKYFDNLVTLFKVLMSKQDEELVEGLRNQILNSLFWYFETLKTENDNLKTVFFTSVLDSFFATNQTKEHKASVIASETTDSVQAEELIAEEVRKLYDDRNKIIHSEIPLFDYQVSGKKRVQMSRSRVEISITQAYNNFLTSRVDRYIQSVKLP